MKRILNLSIKTLCVVAFFIASMCFVNLSNVSKYSVFASEPETNINLAYNQLGENPKKLYNFLEQKIKGVATGDIVETTFVINSATIAEWGLKTKWTNTELGLDEISLNDIQDLFLSQLNLSGVLDALVHDMPYEMFWFDKTVGIINALGGSGNTQKITITSLTIIFSVSKDYSVNAYDENNPKVDQAKVLSAASALTKAKNIVSTYSSLNDYQKILAYKNVICEMVSYNDYAASGSYTGGYGNPWQAIYVFDDNNSTNVVCEGYAKAFQLLCNLSAFKNNVVCYTVSGMMGGGTGAGAHMWNIVVMDDELCYLVDVTNSDLGSVGQSGGLFLVGNNTGSIVSGYSFNLGSVVSYSYNESTKSLWGSDSESILNLSASNYHVNHPEIDIEQKSNLTYDGVAISIGEKGSQADVVYSFLDDEDENLYNWTYEYHLDKNGVMGEKINNAPVNAGNYWLKVTATNKVDSTYKIVHSEKITIKAKELSVVSVVAEQKAFDALASVKVTEVNLLGIINNDEVYVNLSSLNASVSDVGVGTYNYVNLTNISLLGQNKNNYSINNQASNIESNSIQIVPAEPNCVGECTKINVTGKTLNDVTLTVTAKGANNSIVSGTFSWVDEEGNSIHLSTEIIEGEKYWFKFVPNDPNYTISLGYVIPWGIETEEDSGNLSSLDIAKFTEYGLYAIAAILVISCAVVAIKKRKQA